MSGSTWPSLVRRGTISRRAMTKRRLGLLAGIVGMLCMAGGAQTAAVAAEPGRTVLIGFAGPLTDVSVQSAQQGAQLAVEEANASLQRARAPLQFSLLPQDDRSDANMAEYVARYLVKSGVVGVVGHWTTGPALAAAPIYEKSNVAQVNFTSTGNQVTRQGYRTSFRLLGGTGNAGVYLAETAVNVLQGQRIVVVGNDTPYSKALSDSFVSEVASWSKQVMQRSVVSAKTSDFNAPLRAAMEGRADVIFFSANTGQLSAFMEAVRRMKISANILLTGGATNENFSLQDNGKLYAIEPDIPQPQCAAWRAFEQRYAARFGRPPTTFSRFAFNATSMVIQAARQSDLITPATVTASLHRIRHIGLSGEIAFDPAGNTINPTYTLYHATPQHWQVMKSFSADKAMSARCAKG